jgi:hypothetical protein
MSPEEYARLCKLEDLLSKFSTPVPAVDWKGHGYAAWFLRQDDGYMEQTAQPERRPYPPNLYFLPLPRLKDPLWPNSPPQRKRTRALKTE